jgi:uncharacterized protein
MKILITGGSGFLGQALAAELHRQGHSLVIHSRDPHKQAKRHSATPAEWVSSYVDIKSPIDAVVNLAGANLFSRPWTEKRKQALWKSRVNLTNDLVKWLAAQKQPPQVFLSGSAVGYYGNQGEQILNEASAAGTDWAAYMVANWEDASKPAAHSIRTVQLRTGLVLGRGGLLKPILPAFKAGLGGSLADGQFWYSWIHVQDWVNAVIFLLNCSDCQGPYNLSAPNPVRYKQLAEALGNTLHRPVWLTPPRWALKLLLGERAELMLGSTRALPERLQQAGFQWRYPTVQDALAASVLLVNRLQR